MHASCTHRGHLDYFYRQSYYNTIFLILLYIWATLSAIQSDDDYSKVVDSAWTGERSSSPSAVALLALGAHYSHYIAEYEFHVRRSERFAAYL